MSGWVDDMTCPGSEQGGEQQQLREQIKIDKFLFRNKGQYLFMDCHPIKMVISWQQQCHAMDTSVGGGWM